MVGVPKAERQLVLYEKSVDHYITDNSSVRADPEKNDSKNNLQITTIVQVRSPACFPKACCLTWNPLTRWLHSSESHSQ